MTLHCGINIHQQLLINLGLGYNKCIKLFLGYHRRYSQTQVFLETGLPTFDTVMHNSACVFAGISDATFPRKNAIKQISLIVVFF